MIFQKYESYKDSEVEWLGEIPKGWAIGRLKYITDRVGDGLHGTPVYVLDSEYFFINGNNLKDNQIKIFNETSCVSEEEYNKYKLNLDKFTILMSINGTIGSLAYYNNEKVVLGKSVAYINFKKSNNLQYFFYLIGSHSIQEGFLKNIAYSFIKNLSLEGIRDAFILIPTSKEMKKIVLFLDTKTSQINSKIKALQDKIKNYEELRKTLINETVCRGLNKSIELKDSEIEWIGEIPKHWKLSRGKNIFCELGKSQISASEGEDKAKYKFFTSSVNQSKWLNTYTENGEEIIFSTGGIAGVHYCEKEFSYSTDCYAIKNKSEFIKYYFYYFKSKLYEIDTIAFQGAGLRHLQRDFIKAERIPQPPKPEQIQIAKYLDEKTSKIDKIILKIDEQIKTLTEFRKTLINDVVTGKVRVQDE